MQTLSELLNTLPHDGVVEWIGLRPKRRAEIRRVECVGANPESGLDGDRYAGRSGKRQVTLIQSEHLEVIRQLQRMADLPPSLLRRNLLVSGINLLALKDRKFKVGDVTLQGTGLCHPCSFMEEVLGAGGYNSMRGHGGITARVLSSGVIRTRDRLLSVSSSDMTS